MTIRPTRMITFGEGGQDITAEDADNTKTKVLSQHEENEIAKRKWKEYYIECGHGDIKDIQYTMAFPDWLDRRE